jgi:hypothetical protein
MKNLLIRIILTGLIFSLAYIGYTVYLFFKKNDVVPVSVIGVHHLGRNYSISEFYLNKQGGTGVQREGGGGGIVCCVLIPSKWRPGLTVQVRWRVEDWSRENRVEIEAGNYDSVAVEGIYGADVLVEEYHEPGDLYVHFFSAGKVRVFSSLHTVFSPQHPAPYGHNDGEGAATPGTRLTKIFSDEEKNSIGQRRNLWK